MAGAGTTEAPASSGTGVVPSPSGASGNGAEAPGGAGTLQASGMVEGAPIGAVAGSGAGGASEENAPAASGGSLSGEGAGGASANPGVGGGTEHVPLDPGLLARCTGTNPISCALQVPDGNYDISVELGDPASAGTSRVSAETRHYAGPAVQTAAGAFSFADMTVNVREEVHDGGQRAPGGVLNLLIDGAAPKLHGLGIRPAASAITVFIASDSTACDWVSTNMSSLAEDETGWGQVLSMYFKPGVAIANYADSGETSGSFFTRFFPPARAAMKAGDYLFIQFGHNNKSDADIAAYEGDLSRYVAAARGKGAIPVIITPVSRASATATAPGFNGLDKVARDLAARDNVALIDLTALSRAYYATVPDKNALFIDGTHFHEGGAIGVAGVVAAALKSSDLELKAFLK